MSFFSKRALADHVYEDPHRWDRLAQYNAERARGIMHTDHWRLLMSSEQAAFDRAHPRQSR